MSQRFQSPFGRHSTASEVIDGVDLSGKRAIVTGASSGIGIETARALASAGAEVALAVRRTQAAEEIAAGIVRSTGNTKVSVRPGPVRPGLRPPLPRSLGPSPAHPGQ